MFLDDYMFPITRAGRQAAGIFESARDEKDDGNAVVLESADFGTRSRAMSSVLTWIEEGVFTYEALDEVVVAAADLDGDFDISEEEEEEYGDIWEEVPYALMTLGASAEEVQTIYDGPSKEADEAAARVGAALKNSLDEESGSDYDIINDFALGEDDILESVFEAAYKRKKVIRDGVKVVIRKRVAGSVRLSAGQKKALRKARQKANTANARRKRQKSIKKGKSMGVG